MEEYKKITQGDMPVVVKVYTDWCSLCPSYEPTFKSVAAEHKDHAVFISVNAEKPGFKELFKGHVTGYPTTLIVKGGEITAAKKGLIDKRLLTKFVTDNIGGTSRPSRTEEKPMIIEKDVAIEEIEDMMMPMDRDMDEEEMMPAEKPVKKAPKKAPKKKVQPKPAPKKTVAKTTSCGCPHSH